MTHHPPGEPPAEEIAEQLADLVVIDGPNTGEVWTYLAAKGGYVRADGDPDEEPCVTAGAVIVEAGGNVRPVTS